MRIYEHTSWHFGCVWMSLRCPWVVGCLGPFLGRLGLPLCMLLKIRFYFPSKCGSSAALAHGIKLPGILPRIPSRANLAQHIYIISRYCSGQLLILFFTRFQNMSSDTKLMTVDATDAKTWANSTFKATWIQWKTSRTRVRPTKSGNKLIRCCLPEQSLDISCTYSIGLNYIQGSETNISHNNRLHNSIACPGPNPDLTK